MGVSSVAMLGLSSEGVGVVLAAGALGVAASQ